MPRIGLIRFMFYGATLAFALSLGEPAQACPDVNFCNYLINGSPFGRRNTNAEERVAPPERRVDPMQLRVNAASGMVKLMTLSLQQNINLYKDPRYQRYRDGGWDFFQADNNAPPGEYCSAFFWKKEGMVTLSGPGGEYRGALLTFWGKDIPRPDNVEKIKVSLTQSDGLLQTVYAFNYTKPGDTYGAISFAVPTLEAALAEMKDIESFDVAIDGKSVTKVEWHSGLMARDKLRECLNAKAKK
ncbi:MAG: hypothetical protein DCF19_23140 [Pseudanabaena frigida]|uniref:Uncharacterized protein n=1 Tax=Pseudanabaena frigida TaxID=945775 RepID=A0A2W4XJ58_9CYAN|nr:MAG: hypothetical protein DCF19_23140 [Pseudanabaena frigida]